MRLRLAVSGVVTAAVTLVVLWVILSAVVRAAAVDDQRASLSALARQAATLEDLPPFVVIDDPREDTSAFISLIASDGTRVHSSAVGSFAPEVPAAVILETLEKGTSSATFEASGVELRVEAVIWNTAREPGVAAAMQSTAVIDEQIQGVQTALGFASIITLLAAAIVGWAVAGRALRPLNSLIATADDIEDTGDLRRRLKPAKRKDEVQRLTRSFNGMLDRLEGSTRQIEESLERQRRFVADASHELRTPLTTIRSNAGFLAERPDAVEKDRLEAAQDIVAEADRMARLVGDLLTLARADADVDFRHVRVDLQAIAQEVARQTGDAVALEAHPVAVNGDPDLLTRLLWILVDNARRHGAPPVEISVTTDTEAVISVSDHGPGIPPAERERVFERFHRADWARATPGAGLGLAIAREIALRHGGSISAGSAPSGGARIEVRIPILIDG